MNSASRIALACGLLVAVLPVVATAQEGNNPPTIEIIAWDVFHEGDWVIVYDRDLGIGTLDAIDAFVHHELDVVAVTLEITDADWEGGGPDGNDEDEEYFLRFRTVGWSFGAPEAPPIIAASNDFYGASEDSGFAPPPGQLVSTNTIMFAVPEFLGRNQDRLRGFVDYDVFWVLQFTVANEEDPEDEFVLDSEIVLLRAIEDPFLGTGNPPAFADAGADRTVAADTQVVLNGGRSFDGNNVGFDPDDENIFEKDTLVFTWEWISGPVRVDPVQTSIVDPTATVTLVVPGDYVYRLIVDDNANALPSTDSVTITVVQELPPRNPPRAAIRGPAGPVPIGGIITLTSESTDPDGDDLALRWQQTDALGGALPAEELQDVFQPLSGMTSDIASWQALTAGTYYFRLLVDDGFFESSARFTVVVIDTVTGGASLIVDDGSDGATGEQSESGAAAPKLCGAGLLPLAAFPLALCLMRRRIR